MMLRWAIVFDKHWVRTMRWLGFVLVLACFLIDRGAPGQDVKNDGSNLSVEQVVETLRKHEAEIKTLSVKISSKELNHYPQMLGGGGFIRSSATAQWQMEPSGRGWCRATGTSLTVGNDAKRSSLDFQIRSGFDGEYGINYRNEIRANGSERPTARGVASVLGPTISPLDFTFNHQGKRVDSLLKRNAKIVAKQLWQSREVLVIETQPVRDDTFKSQFWVDVERGCTVVRRINLFRKTTDESWLPAYAVNSFDHKKVMELWLPSRFEVRSYMGKPKEGDEEPPIALRSDGTCSSWSLDRVLDQQKLRIDVPRSVKITGKVPPQKKIKQGAEKNRNFYVLPIKTELQKSRLGRTADAYAAIDVTGFVDVNTRELEMDQFDFEQLKKDLKAVCADKAKVLKMHLYYRSLGTDKTLRASVTWPLEKMAQDAGFNRTLITSSFGSMKSIKYVDPTTVQDADEDNLGNARCEIYCVKNVLSKRIIDNVDFIIGPKEPLPVDPAVMLSEEMIALIAKAAKDENVSGKSVAISFQLGDKNTDPNAAMEPPAVQQDSEQQVAVVHALRQIGFGDIRIKSTIGYRAWSTGYRK